MPAEESAMLARYAREQDAEAFRYLVEGHQHMVFAVCRRILGNRADAEDAAQHCFLQLARKAERLKAPIAGWLHRVAVQASIDLLRKRTSRLARERKAAAMAAPERDATWDEVKDYVDRAISALPERLQVPIVMYFLEGHTQADVAEELGISQPAVSGRLKRGVEGLRKRLREQGVLTSGAALVPMLAANAMQEAPATLTAALGKMALAGMKGSRFVLPAGAKVLAVLALLAMAVLAASAITGIGLAVRMCRDLQRTQPTAGPSMLSEDRAVAGDAGPDWSTVRRTLNKDGVGREMLLDLDTGKGFSLQKDVADVDTLVNRARERGVDVLYDVHVSATGLIGVDLQAARVEGAAWEEIGPADVQRLALDRPPSGRALVLLEPDGQSPATFFFGTREGGRGVLQILSVSRSRGVRIRYRIASAGRPN